MAVRFRRTAIVGILLLATGVPLAAKHRAHHTATPAPLASASLALADGSPAGTASLHVSHGKASLRLALKGLPPGVHGIHLHAVGKCEAPEFKTAGGHLNPAMHQHGTLNPMGHHLGDLPNVTADATGRVTTTLPLESDAASLPAALFDADGTALVIHAGPDDYKTDPSGNSGGRIACGVLTRG